MACNNPGLSWLISHSNHSQQWVASHPRGCYIRAARWPKFEEVTMVRHLHPSRARTQAAERLKQLHAQQRAFEALRLMRKEGLSLTRATRKAHTTPRTAIRRVGPALRRGPEGRYVAMPSDRLPRTVRLITPTGLIPVTVSLRAASRIARHAVAVDRFLKTGETDALEPFRGAFIRVGNVRHPFVTDPRTLTRLGNAGQVAFEDLYVLTI